MTPALRDYKPEEGSRHAGEVYRRNDLHATLTPAPQGPGRVAVRCTVGRLGPWQKENANRDSAPHQDNDYEARVAAAGEKRKRKQIPLAKGLLAEQEADLSRIRQHGDPVRKKKLRVTVRF